MKKIKFLMPALTICALSPMTTMVCCNSETTQEEYIVVGPIKYQLDWQTQTAKAVNFDKTKDVKQVEIPEMLTVSDKNFTITEIDSHAFINAAKIESLNMPDTITKIGDYAFERCSALLSIKLSEGLEIIGESAFDSCQKLSSITIPKHVNEIKAHAFYGCTGLTEIKVNSENETYSDGGCNCIIYNKEENEKELLYAADNNELQIPEGITEIAPYACYLHSNIENITIPSTVKNIDEYAFKNCEKLASVEFASLSNLNVIGNNAFEGCHNLTSVQKFPSSLKQILNKAFYECKNLSNITFNDELAQIGYMAFSKTAIQEVTLTKNVFYIDGAPFADCPNLKEIKVNTENPIFTSQNDASQECNCIMNKSHTFIYQGCGDAWQTEIIPESISCIYDYAFEGCGFSKITLPKNLKDISIGAFSGCTKLTEIELPDSLERIESVAFGNCGKLESVNIPKNVISLGISPFEGCVGLTDITVSEDNTQYTSKYDGNEYNCIMNKVTDYSNLKIIQGCSETDIGGIDPLKKIDPEAFYGIFRKAEDEQPKYIVNLPSSISEIGNLAFAECDGIKEINFAGKMDDWKLIQKGLNWSLSIPTLYVHCTDGDCPIHEGH